MASKKISELTAAGAITGAELVPIVQGGVTKRTAASTLGATTAAGISYDNDSSGLTADDVQEAIDELASATGGLDLDSLQTTLAQYDIAEWSANINDVGSGAGGGQGITCATLTDSFAVVAEDPTSACALIRGRNVQDTTPATANRRGGIYSSTASMKKCYRRVSGDATAGGFYFFSRFSFLVAENGQRAFCGLYASVTPPGISAVMDDLPNAIGIGKDEGDTNLSIVRQAGSGGATKTSLGVTIASLQAKTIEFELIAAAGGTTVDYRIRVLETGVTFTGTISTALPATDAGMHPLHWINSGLSSNAMKIGLARVAVWNRT